MNIEQHLVGAVSNLRIGQDLNRNNKIKHTWQITALANGIV